MRNRLSISPQYIVIEPVEPGYIYIPVYDPVVVYGAGYWLPAYVPFFWYPSWWTVGPVFGFAAAGLVGPAYGIIIIVDTAAMPQS